MLEPIFETVKRRLDDSKGDLTRIAEESGVNIWTIRNIVNGRSSDPQVSTCQKLLDYFEAHDAMLAKLRQGATAG